MTVTIHRGTHQIGGSCVELRQGDSRILVDCGLPLAGYNSIPALVGTAFDAVLISHAHADHFGLLATLSPAAPVFCSEATARLIRLNREFGLTELSLDTWTTFTDQRPFAIGPFTVTPFPMDHSAFDSYAFLVEAGGTRLFYSGDFRRNGRKGKLFQRLLDKPPQAVDALLMEGTGLGRVTGQNLLETELEEQIYDRLRTTSGLALVACSAQNLDRMVTLYKAARHSGRTFVIDVYAAEVLRVAAEFAALPVPAPRFPGLGVWFPRRLTAWALRHVTMSRVGRWAKFKTRMQNLQSHPGRYLVLVRPNMLAELQKLEVGPRSLFLWSQWAGYLEEPSTKPLIDFLGSRGVAPEMAHTSGHADVATLAALVQGLQPRSLLPIHTEAPGRFHQFGVPVLNCRDGDPIVFEKGEVPSCNPHSV
ncbi:MAG: MBL fold metallo-hydrolase [Spirochaetales bacterium]